MSNSYFNNPSNIQCNTIQCIGNKSVIQYNTRQCNTIQYITNYCQSIVLHLQYKQKIPRWERGISSLFPTGDFNTLNNTIMFY